MRKDCYNKMLNDDRDPDTPHSFRQPYHVLFPPHIVVCMVLN